MLLDFLAYNVVVSLIGMVNGRLNLADIRLQLLLDPSSLAHYLVSREDWRVWLAHSWFLLQKENLEKMF